MRLDIYYMVTQADLYTKSSQEPKSQVKLILRGADKARQSTSLKVFLSP